MADKKGCQTPTSCVYLLDEERTNLAKEAAGYYKATGKTAQKWQSEICKHILARNKEGLWTHTKFGYEIPRRNGKTDVILIRVLYGLENNEKLLYTAHRSTTSQATFERVEAALDSMGYIKASEIRKDDEVKDDMLYDSYKAAGRESIKLRKNGAKINFRTRTSKGGLGEGYDTLIIDEAQEYTEEQESALKYMVTDSKNPQTLLCGTPPTAVSSGTVFVDMRNRCLEGKSKNWGWAEWSVDKQTDPYDRQAWYRTNPSLGVILTERGVEDEIGSDEVDFNIQRLGYWIQYNQKSEISEEQWNQLQIDEETAPVGKLHVGIKFGKDGKHIALSIAARLKNGRFFVECLYCKPVNQGIDWIIGFLQKAAYEKVVSDGAAGQEALESAMHEAKLKNLVFPKVHEVIAANAAFEQLLYAKRIAHNGQESLAQVVSNCKKRKIGTSGGFGYESINGDMDIAIMDSAIFALWSLSRTKERRRTKTTYY